MKVLNRISKGILTLGLVMGGQSVIAQEAEAAVTVVAAHSATVYEKLGMSSTALFTIMTIFTLILLFFMVSIAGSTKNIIEFKQKKKKESNLKAILALAGLFFSSTLMAAEPGSLQGSIPFPDSVFWGYIIVDVILIMFIIYFVGIIKGTISELVVFERIFKWTKLKKNLTDAVPIESEASILLDHDYDGITELDNNLPPWWKYGFYITIVWAVVYFFYYQILEIGDLQEAEYLAEMEEGEREVAAYKLANPQLINADNVELLTDGGAISQGKAEFDTYCVSCHKEGGIGSIGPNLTDDYWLYENDIKGVFSIISEGAQNGMPAWKELIPANKIQMIASYVLQLDEVLPPQGGKEPQGELK